MSKTHSLLSKETLVGIITVTVLVVLIVVNGVALIPAILEAYIPSTSSSVASPIDTETVRQALQLLQIN